MGKRIITTDLTDEDKKVDNTLRPQKLDDYIGQTKAKGNLKVYIEAAKQIFGSRVILWTSRSW